MRYYLLEGGENPAGCVALEQASADSCYIERLAVVPAFRRLGFGEALISHAIDEARRLGVQRVELGVVAAQTELMEWYERLGFVTTATRQFPHLPFEVAFMRKDL